MNTDSWLVGLLMLDTIGRTLTGVYEVFWGNRLLGFSDFVVWIGIDGYPHQLSPGQDYGLETFE